MIVKETSDRQNADNGLQQNITQEAQNRQNADVYKRQKYIHMYVSKYYTCEEIDQRLLQGYYDDSLEMCIRDRVVTYKF